MVRLLYTCNYVVVTSNSNSSLFINKHGGLHIAVLYVDDMIVMGNDVEQVAQLQEELSIHFEMKKLGELNHFLGLVVENLKNGLFVSHKGYLENL